MKNKDVEPLVLVLQRSLELDAFVFEGHVEPFIFHVSDAVEGDFGIALAKQDWQHFDVLNVRHFAKVVHVVVLTHEVDIAEVFEAARVVVVTVDHENRHGN